ncbi:LVIS_2131 family protein [Lapidilactobacillus luobeiensis]|uniref:LVIS_2131 family protein n=1 Tax=Lapidilactobacillus luobeiensis TaxID=2950371 RepID=UPI0021C37ECE|nr:LVIS_2131 family protein [Lapidilactobacillus luobeiensis]
MNFGWNLIGIGAWLLLMVYLVIIIQNIRHRHIRMIVMNKKTFSWKVLSKDLLLVVVFLAGFVFMTYQTLFSRVEVTAQDRVEVKYTTEPLVLQTSGDTGYMVTVARGEGREAIQTYTYWTEGHRNQVKSIHASIATGSKPIPIGAKVYHFPNKMIKKADKQYNQAFAARVEATYKPGFWNGLGMKVGHNALEYTMIRVPSSTFVSED